jgi:hypothetical protein
MIQNHGCCVNKIEQPTTLMINKVLQLIKISIRKVEAALNWSDTFRVREYKIVDYETDFNKCRINLNKQSILKFIREESN